MIRDREYEQTLWKNRYDLIEQIFENTVAQERAIQEEDEDRLLQLLDARNELMLEVDRLDLVIKESGMLDQPCENMNQWSTKIQARLLQIIELDKKNKVKVESAKIDIRRKMMQVQQGKKAMDTGYFRQEEQAYGYYFDKKIGK